MRKGKMDNKNKKKDQKIEFMSCWPINIVVNFAEPTKGASPYASSWPSDNTVVTFKNPKEEKEK